MALQLRKIPSVSNVRTFAAAAAAQKKDAAPSGAGSTANPYLIPREDLKVSKVNNITVASVETNKPLAKLAVYFRAGSRFETDTTQGIVQMLRISAGLGTGGASQFALTRSLEASGGNLYCSSGREFIGYTVEAARESIPKIEKFMREIATNQVFKPWEVKDNVNRLRLERAIRSPEVRIMELIHKSAFRKGLGYSLYSPKWMVGNHTTEMLANYVKGTFGEASVVATGLPHEQVKLFASRLQLQGAGPTKIEGSKFNPGSELRKETNTDLAYVALAVEGASFANLKDQVISALLHRALSSGPRTKRGTASGGKLLAAISEDASLKAAVTAFSTNYAETGLLGVFIAATPCSVEEVTKKSAEILLGSNFSDQDLVRSKALLKADLSYATETDGGYLEEIGLQSLIKGSVSDQTEVDAVVDSITSGDLNSFVKKGKLSMASFGKLNTVPYLDTLKK